MTYYLKMNLCYFSTLIAIATRFLPMIWLFHAYYSFCYSCIRVFSSSSSSFRFVSLKFYLSIWKKFKKKSPEFIWICSSQHDKKQFYGVKMEFSFGLGCVTSQRAYVCTPYAIFSDCNEHYYHRFSDLFPLFPHRLLFSQKSFHTFQNSWNLSFQCTDIPSALFFPFVVFTSLSLLSMCVCVCMRARALHCFTAHFSGHSSYTLGVFFLFFSLSIGKQKHITHTVRRRTTNLRE